MSFKKRSSLLVFVGSTVFSLLSNAAESTNSTTALFDAIERNDAQAVEQAITSGSDVNAKDNYGRTPLHMAVLNSNPEIVELLLKAKGIDINARANYGATPLHMAASSKSPAVMELLLQTEGIDVNARADNDITPLHRAASLDSPELVKLLLQAKGIDVNAKDDNGITPLHGAVSWHNLALVKCLLQTEGIDVNARNRFSATPLHNKVLCQRSEELKKTLIRFGATVDPEKLTDQQNEDLRTLIQETREETQDALLESIPLLPKDLAREITRMVIQDVVKVSKQE